MIFFPYKADVELNRLPILTLMVCIICTWVFTRQAMSERAHTQALQSYCANLASDESLVLRYLDVPANTNYCSVLLHLRSAPDREAEIRKLADTSRPTAFYPTRADSVGYIYNVLTESVQRFVRAVPNSLTERLHFDPNHATAWATLTAAFSHGDVWHLISNLVFFFAFAASVEVITGYTYYLGYFLLCAAGTHYAYAFSVRGEEVALPTIGLSGVVMAMMGFLAVIRPSLRIRCFFWFFLFIRRFGVPASVIAVLYIVENIYDYKNRHAGDMVNYVAHISGAAIGIAMGFIYRLRNHQYLDSLRTLT